MATKSPVNGESVGSNKPTDQIHSSSSNLKSKAQIIKFLSDARSNISPRNSSSFPHFKPGDTIKVHTKITEGTKERIQVFEGIVIKIHKGNKEEGTFTVRKVSYNIGVERTFFFFSPRLEKIELVNRGLVRRSRLFYLRPLRGKAARVKTQFLSTTDIKHQEETPIIATSTSDANGNGGNSSKKSISLKPGNKNSDAGKTKNQDVHIPSIEEAPIA
jgi:large subunit ribosomal protein L19